MSIWIIEESPNPGVWNIVQSCGIYKSGSRAKHSAARLERWHKENLTPTSKKFGWRYRATEYTPKAAK